MSVQKVENGGNGGKLEFEVKKQIILSYIDADISGSIPTQPAFIPGVGQSPNPKAHADDTFRLIATNYGDTNKQSFVDALIKQLGLIINIHLDM